MSGRAARRNSRLPQRFRAYVTKRETEKGLLEISHVLWCNYRLSRSRNRFERTQRDTGPCVTIKDQALQDLLVKSSTLKPPRNGAMGRRSHSQRKRNRRHRAVNTELNHRLDFANYSTVY
ncbi:hypothetical protein AV530_002499 [Patagioenas fasciata monilis]|uniref:Uncharacterized protein n=1 Tax=Patagioenas fasciata monilis TaxID=372326 RepID=A0A1V4K6V0_PATFA|nr:hypothetical protein AV530_002499 [Patagioenas fasciata monilis]